MNAGDALTLALLAAAWFTARHWRAACGAIHSIEQEFFPQPSGRTDGHGCAVALSRATAALDERGSGAPVSGEGFGEAHAEGSNSNQVIDASGKIGEFSTSLNGGARR